MKHSKIYLFGLAALASLGIGLSSCQDDFEGKEPNIEVPVASHQANMSILDFKAAYWPKDEAGNFTTTVTDYVTEVGCLKDANGNETEEHIYLAGRVISSDEAGNVFKSLVIQDETAALAFSINQYDLYLNYPIGQEVVVDVTGLYAGMYRGLFQIGMPSESNGIISCSFLPDELFKRHAEKNGAPEPDMVKTITLENFNAMGTSPEALMKMQSQYIRFNDVHFELGGQTTYATYKNTEDRTLLDATGASIVVRTSGYSNFWQYTLPADNFDIEGIMGYYASGSKTAYQMILNSYAGVMNVGNPTATPGTEKNPYTVDDMIASLVTNNPVGGWVKGYIVGAVAPDVTEVKGNADIEFAPTPIMPNTLVIGATPDTKDFNACLVIELPAGSDLREYGNLADHPELYQKEIMVSGLAGIVMGTYGVTNNNGTPSEFRIEGLDIKDPTGEGDGSEESPYNTAQIIAMNPGSTTEAVATGVWVTGYIVGSIPTGGASTNLSVAEFGFTNAATSNLIIAPSSSCTNTAECVVVQLPSGSSVRSGLNLADNPGNLGKLVSVKGDIMKYCGAPGVKNTSEYKMDGSTPDVPVTPGNPTGDGTQANPYNAAMALQVATSLPADTPTEEVYVSGIVSSVTEISTSFGNGTFYISDDGSKNGEFLIYRAYYLNGDKFTSTDQVKVGDKVVVLGKLVNFKGNTPEMTQGGKLVSIEGGDTPDVPNPPTGAGSTVDNPYNVAQALQIIADGKYTADKVYIAGTISAIDEVSTQYGNAHYYISDNGTTATQLEVFRGYYLNGDKFTAENQIKVGDKVVILGALTSYNGKPQVNTGSQIVKLNGEGGNDTPTPDPDPTPVTGNSADFNTFNNGTANTSTYATYKTAQGWTATWSLILSGGTEATNFISSDTKMLCPCIDGTPARPGTLTSPTISGGLKKLTFNYGFPYNETKCAFTVNILQGGKVVASDTVTLDTLEKAKVYNYSHEFSVSGDFVIQIVNDCLSQATVNNKDRVAIWNLTWEN